MEYRRLGRSGLQVSALTLGSASFGELVDKAGVTRIVDVAVDGGVSTFDTADSYGKGLSEEYIGAALRGKRDQVVLCTKVGQRVGDDVEEFQRTLLGTLDHDERWSRGIARTDAGLSRKHIVSALEASLRRLGTDYVDLYQVHRWDNDVPIEETLAALDQLVCSGKVRYVGCSSYASWQILKSLWASDVGGWTSFVSMQVSYNMLNRSAEESVLPACMDVGMGVLNIVPLAGGMLTGRYDFESGPEPGSRYAARPHLRNQFWNEAVFTTVAKLDRAARECGRTPGQLALGWVSAHPAVSSVLVGCEEPEQFAEAVAVFNDPLSGDEVAKAREVVADAT
jgi:1-deoxyxylulose-5-phosphate synthase